MREKTNYERLQENKVATKEAVESYLADAPAPTRISPVLNNPENSNYATLIEALEERRDSLCNISRKIIGNQLIRDGRNAQPTTDSENASSFAIQYLNICQAAELLLENAEKKGEILKEEADKARATIKLSANEILSNLDNEKNIDPKARNSALVSILRGVKGVGGAKPFDKGTLTADLNFAKEIVQLDMPCYHVSTISSVKDKERKPRSVVESEVMFLGLTETQKAQFDMIAAGRGSEIDWYDGLDNVKQDLIKKYAGTIAKGEHVIPTQLIKSIPLLRNAYTKVTSIVEGDNSLKILMEDNHSGAPTFHGKGDQEGLSRETVEQAKSISGAEELGLTTLNSSIDVVGLDSSIVSMSEKMPETMGKVSVVIAPLNRRRGFSTDTIKKEYNEPLKQVGLVAEHLKLENTAKFLSGEKKPGFFNSSYEKAALEELNKSELSDEVKADFKTAIEARSKINKKSWGGWSLFGTGAVNETLEIVSRMNIISYSMNRGSLKDHAVSAGASVAERIIFCKSGKDRTALAEEHISHLSVSNYLGIDPAGEIAKENLLSMVNASHAQTMASMQGGSRGCFGVLTSSLAHMPDIYPKSLTSVTASYNKFKVNFRSKIIGLLSVLRGAGRFIANMAKSPGKAEHQTQQKDSNQGMEKKGGITGTETEHQKQADLIKQITDESSVLANAPAVRPSNVPRVVSSQQEKSL